MTQIHRLFPLLALLAFTSATWSQETPPAETKPADAAKEAAPKFSATLLLIKSDWSKSPHATEIEAELREALKDATVPKELLDKLPASGPQILFAPEIVSFYFSEHFAEFLAWLKAKELVVEEDPYEHVGAPTNAQSEFRNNITKLNFSQYDQNQNGKLEKEEWQITFEATTEAGKVADANKDDAISPEEFEAASLAEAEKQARNTRVIKRDAAFIELPRPRAQRDQPFVMRRPELTWSVARRDTSSIQGMKPMSYSLSRTRTFFEQARGASKPEHGNMVDSCSLGFNLPNNHVAVVNAFPAKTEEDYRIAARKRGFEAVVVVAAAAPREDQQPRLHLPDWIEVTHIEHEVQGQRPSYMALPPEAPAFQETTLTKIFHLQHASAADLRDILKQLAPENIKLAVDERTNSIIVSGAEEKLAELEAIALRLDEAGSAKEDKRPAHPAGTVAELKQQYAAAEQEAAALAKEAQPPKEKLRAAVAKAFELRQKLLQAELSEFRQRSQRIEKSLTQREGIKQQIIERRVEDLLKPGLEWNGAEAKPAARSAKNVATTQSSPEQTARQAGALRLQELELRQAEAKAQVAELELAGAVKANRKVAGTFPQNEMSRLQAQLEIAHLGVEKARTMVELLRHAAPDGNPVSSPSIDRATRIKLLELDIKQATLEVEGAEVAYKAEEELASAGVISSSELTEAKLAVTRARSKLEKSQVLLDAERQAAAPQQ